jgi:hypothetical protein
MQNLYQLRKECDRDSTLNYKIHILFYVDNSWTVGLTPVKLSIVKVQKHTYKFIWIMNVFDEALKYGDGSKFWEYVGTNAEPLRVEFCSFE